MLIPSAGNSSFSGCVITTERESTRRQVELAKAAKDRQEQAHLDPVTAVLEACRLRLRPVLMTSIAFIMGVWPLVSSHGAGAEMRRAVQPIAEPVTPILAEESP